MLESKSLAPMVIVTTSACATVIAAGPPDSVATSCWLVSPFVPRLTTLTGARVVRLMVAPRRETKLVQGQPDAAGTESPRPTSVIGVHWLVSVGRKGRSGSGDDGVRPTALVKTVVINAMAARWRTQWPRRDRTAGADVDAWGEGAIA